MKILCVDSESNGIDMLLRAQSYGHDVRIWDKARKNGSDRRAGEGLIPKLRDWEELRKRWLGWADLIWFPQNSAYVDLIEPYRKMGYPVYGANVEAVTWESDRARGQQIMKECGMQIIPAKEFTDYDAAIAYVKRRAVPLVSKPSGEADKALSYVAKRADDLVYMLTEWKRNPKYVSDAKKFGFIIQEKKSGCEMGVGGFFGPGGWAGMWEENWENKKFMAGDVGPNTGEQGTVMRYVRKSKLADIALVPLTKKLKALGYVGCVAVNGGIDDKGTYWPYEFTMRDGWPARHNQQALILNVDPMQWMLDLVNGKDTIEQRDGLICVSVVVALPPYPKEDEATDKQDGRPVYNLDLKHVHPCDIRMADKVPTQAADGSPVVDMPGYVTAGAYVCVVTGTGDTVTAARRSVYAAIKRLHIVGDPMWRNDIGAKLGRMLPDIQKHGFARGMQF